MFVADTPNSILYVSLASLKGAVRLEGLGMKRRGRSATAIAKQIFGLRTRDRQKILDYIEGAMDLLRENKDKHPKELGWAGNPFSGEMWE